MSRAACVLAVAALTTSTLAVSTGTAGATPGTPIWRYDYGVGSASLGSQPALTHVQALGLGSNGRMQLAFPDHVQSDTAVGEHSRSLPITNPAAVTSDGTRDFVTVVGSQAIQEYPATGTTATPLPTGEATGTLVALAVTAADPYYGEEVVWTVDNASQHVIGVDTAGNLVARFPSRAANVTGLATGPDGTLFVLDGVDGFVQRLTSQGVPTGRFGSSGTGNGQFGGAEGIAVDSAGTVFIGDTDNGRVDMFSSDGSYLGQFGTQVHFPLGAAYTYLPGEFSAPASVVVDCIGRLHVLDVAPVDSTHPQPVGRVAVYTGVAKPTGTCYGPRTDQFAGPANASVVAVDRAGNDYVATNTTITKYDAAGHVITSWSSPSGAGHWTSAAAITVGPAGDVYLVDGNQKKVFEFHAAGTYVRNWTPGGGFTPNSIAVRAATGDVYVSDVFHDVEHFTASGTLVGTVKLADLGAAPAFPLSIGMAGNTLLVSVSDEFGMNAAVERFDSGDNYLDQVAAPVNQIGPDYGFAIAPYPGGGYAFFGAPNTGDFGADASITGIVRLAADGSVLGRVAEPVLPPRHVPSAAAVDCTGRLIFVAAPDNSVVRLHSSSTVCKWLPTATTGTVASRTTTSLTVRASANPSAQVTKLRVAYGPTTAYGHATAWITLPSDNVTITRSVVITGLAHAHTYHYRVEVSNASGTVHGADKTGQTS